MTLHCRSLRIAKWPDYRGGKVLIYVVGVHCSIHTELYKIMAIEHSETPEKMVLTLCLLFEQIIFQEMCFLSQVSFGVE